MRARYQGELRREGVGVVSAVREGSGCEGGWEADWAADWAADGAIGAMWEGRVVAKGQGGVGRQQV